MPASSAVTMLFGSKAGESRAPAHKNNQSVAESLTSTTSRKVKGPKKNGGLSLDLRCDSSSGVTSATGITVWYSNMPEPAEASDNDWVQDTTVGTALALTATGSAFLDLTGKRAEWVRVKCDVTAGTAGVRVFYRAEGVEV